jgi:hypothetical protein
LGVARLQRGREGPPGPLPRPSLPKLPRKRSVHQSKVPHSPSIAEDLVL